MVARAGSTIQARPGRRVCLLERESNLGIAPEAIATQDHALHIEVERRGDRVVAVCVDDGYSGELPPLERPAIVQMLQLADRGEIDYVLATELSRANRGEAFNFYFIKHELAKAGVGLEFIDQTYQDDGESEAGALIEGIQVLLPSIEKRAIRRRFARGRQRVAQEGFSWVSRRPFGLEYTPGGQHKHTWAKRLDEVPHVERMFQLAADGYSREAIAKIFNADGVPSTRGGQWWGSTVWGIISNPRYKGEFPIGRYQTVRAKRAYTARPSRPSTGREGKARRRVKTGHTIRPVGDWVKTVYHPECQIVSAELWQRANDMAQANAATSSRRTKAPRLLHGLVSCEQPHGLLERAAMHAHQQEKRAPRYLCAWRPAPGARACSRGLPAEPLENEVWALVCELALEPEKMLAQVVTNFDALVAEQRRARARVADAQAQVEKHQRTIDNLALAFYAGDIKRDEYERLRGLAEAHLSEAQKVYDGLRQQADPPEAHPLDALVRALLDQTNGLGTGKSAAEIARRMVQEVLGRPTRDELERLGPEDRRRKVRQVVERVEVGPSGVQVRLRLGTKPLPIGNTRSAACAPAGDCGRVGPSPVCCLG